MARKETVHCLFWRWSYLSCIFGCNYLLIEIDDCCNLHFVENIRRGYQKMFASLQNAWGQVGDKLRDHGKFFLHSHPYTFSLFHSHFLPSPCTCIQHSSPQSGGKIPAPLLHPWHSPGIPHSHHCGGRSMYHSTHWLPGAHPQQLHWGLPRLHQTIPEVGPAVRLFNSHYQCYTFFLLLQKISVARVQAAHYTYPWLPPSHLWATATFHHPFSLPLLTCCWERTRCLLWPPSTWETPFGSLHPW